MAEDPCGDSSIAAALRGDTGGMYGWSLDRRWSLLSLSLSPWGDGPEDDDEAAAVGVAEVDPAPTAA